MSTTYIDLTGDSPGECKPQEEELATPSVKGEEDQQCEEAQQDVRSEEAHRQAIMAFARSRLSSASGSKGEAKRARLESSVQEPGVDQPQPQQPSEQPHPQLPANPNPSTMNDTLFMLRLEREERQRQRQRQEAKAADIGNATEAEGQPVQGPHPPEPAQLKRKRQEQPSSSSASPSPATATILTYNIWFDPDAMEERMQGLGKEIEKAGWPDFVLLQEVTMHALQLFSHAAWVKRYTLIPLPQPLGNYFTLTLARSDTVRIDSRDRVPFSCSCQGRDLTIVRASVKGHPLTVGNTHLESPIPGSKFTAERARQLQECLNLLQSTSQATADIVLGGDMNQIDPACEPDKQLQEAAFVDVWPALRPGQAGLTYDARKNPMLTHNYPGRRLDRFYARFQSRWEAEKIELVGTEPIPGKTVKREVNRSTHATKEVPVLVSDHFGLLLHLKAQPPAGQKLGGRQELPSSVMHQNSEVIVVDDN